MLYQSNTIQVDWIKPGIAKLVFNSPNTINKFDLETVDSLKKAIDSLENKKILSQLKGLILISQKPTFVNDHRKLIHFLAKYDQSKLIHPILFMVFMP